MPPPRPPKPPPKLPKPPLPPPTRHSSAATPGYEPNARDRDDGVREELTTG